MKHTIKGFLQWRKDSYGEPSFEFNKYDFKSNEYEDYATVRPMGIEIDVPDDFDPTADLIAGLEKLKQSKRAELARELIELDDRISKLQALPMAPQTVEPSAEQAA